MTNSDSEQWAKVDRYIDDLVIHSDAALGNALQDSLKAGLPAISVSPCQGKFLQLLAQIHRAQTILEIGTLGGYSTIWLARALPSTGRLITLEVNPQHTEVARANVTRANLLHLVEFRVGPALELLPKLAKESRPPFDLIFIDADKGSTPEYFAWALKLSRRGSLIITDNVVRNGALADSASTDPNVQGMRRFTQSLGAEARVSATVIQTVGAKGYDGFALALVTGDNPQA